MRSAELSMEKVFLTSGLGALVCVGKCIRMERVKPSMEKYIRMERVKPSIGKCIRMEKVKPITGKMHQNGKG